MQPDEPGRRSATPVRGRARRNYQAEAASLADKIGPKRGTLACPLARSPLAAVTGDRRPSRNRSPVAAWRIEPGHKRNFPKKKKLSPATDADGAIRRER
jgi:hypothetical protein